MHHRTCSWVACVRNVKRHDEEVRRRRKAASAGSVGNESDASAWAARPGSRTMRGCCQPRAGAPGEAAREENLGGDEMEDLEDGDMRSGRRIGSAVGVGASGTRAALYFIACCCLPLSLRPPSSHLHLPEPRANRRRNSLVYCPRLSLLPLLKPALSFLCPSRPVQSFPNPLYNPRSLLSNDHVLLQGHRCSLCRPLRHGEPPHGSRRPPPRACPSCRDALRPRA